MGLTIHADYVHVQRVSKDSSPLHLSSPMYLELMRDSIYCMIPHSSMPVNIEIEFSTPHSPHTHRLLVRNKICTLATYIEYPGIILKFSVHRPPFQSDRPPLSVFPFVDNHPPHPMGTKQSRYRRQNRNAMIEPPPPSRTSNVIHPLHNDKKSVLMQ